MPCTHMKKLYQLVDQYDMKLGSSDLIRIVCPLCQMEETCPDRLMDEGADADEEDSAEPNQTSQTKPGQAAKP